MARPGLRASPPRLAPALALVLAALAGPALSGRPAFAQPAAPDGIVLLVFVDGVSFEEALSAPSLRDLGRAGGAALLANPARDGEAVAVIADGRADPGPSPYLLGEALGEAGLLVCDGSLDGGSGRPPGEAAEAVGAADRCPPIPDLDRLPRAMIVLDFGEAPVSGSVAPFLIEVGDRVRATVASLPPDRRAMAMVVTPAPSPRMERAGDAVTPILMASGSAAGLLVHTGPVGTLASDGSRRQGLVPAVDVAPTVLDFLGVPIPAEMDGFPLRIGDTPAPFDLHRLHLEHRRVRVPVQLAELAYVLAVAAAVVGALVHLGRGGELTARTRALLRFLVLTAVAVPLVALAAGLLPTFAYGAIVPFMAGATAGLAWLALRARWAGPVGPFAFLGAAGLAFLVVDAAFFEGRAMAVPLLGGTMFEGVRFYGLPNSFIALLLASALFVAARLPPYSGFVLLVGAGLFAGAPSLGANVGASATLFAGAGLWWVLATRERMGLRGGAFAAGVVALGVAAVLLANRWWAPTPTHATRFVEEAAGVGGALQTLVERLGVSVRQVAEAPPAILPLLGLPAAIWAIRRRPGPIGDGLEVAGPRWRRALLALAGASVVAFFVNDTGVAAAAPAFLYVVAGMTYPALVEAGQGSMTAPAEPPAERGETPGDASVAGRGVGGGPPA